MQILCHTSGVVNLWKPNYGLDLLLKYGFDSIVLDFSVFRSYIVEEFDKYDALEMSGFQSTALIFREKFEKVRKELASFAQKCKGRGIQIPLAQIPGFGMDGDEADWHLGYLLIKECMRVCCELGVYTVIISPLQADQERNREYYLRLLPWVKEFGLQILLMNQYKNLGGHYVRGAYSDAFEAKACISELNQLAGGRYFSFCMDVGVCNLCRQNMYEFSVTLGDEIRAAVIKDNDGSTPGAMLPYASVRARKCKTDWVSLFRGLRKIDFDGYIVMDFRDSISAVPIPLRSAVLQYAKQIGHHLIFQIELERVIRRYDKRVLFGAGNMCRNYMKCYGDSYPPLYTCDNNPALWGTKFEGLTVKEPEELKHLSKDCAIFICNMYYEEIREQLKNLGIQNPIYDFNDEYMPSFYLNRFDSETREIW